MQTCFLTPSLSTDLDGGLLQHTDAADFILVLLDAKTDKITLQVFPNLSSAAFRRSHPPHPPPFKRRWFFGQPKICRDKRSRLLKGGGEPQRQAGITVITGRTKQFLFYHSSIFALRNGP